MTFVELHELETHLAAAPARRHAAGDARPARARGHADHRPGPRPPRARERIPGPHDPRRAEGDHLPRAGRPHRAAEPARGARVPRECRRARHSGRRWDSRRCRSCPSGESGCPGPRSRRIVGARAHRPRLRRPGEGARGARGSRAPARLARRRRTSAPVMAGRREGAGRRGEAQTHAEAYDFADCSTTPVYARSSAAACPRISSSRTARWPSTSSAPRRL